MSDDNIVKLKPILGVKPEQYLIVIYATIFALLFFIVLILPGIKNPGTQYSFTSVPSNSAVYIDGNYVGGTPCKVFVSSGEHFVKIESKHFETYETNIITKGRLVGSLIFKRKEVFETNLKLLDADALLSDTFKEFASWGMIDKFYEDYHYKPILEPLFRDFQKMGFSDTTVMTGFLYSALPFVHNEDLFLDLIGAIKIYEEIKTGEKVILDENIIENFTKMTFFQDSVKFMENLPFWFYSLVEDQNKRENLNWYSALQEEYAEFSQDYSNDYPSVLAAVNIHGMRFLRLSGGEFLVGADGYSFPFPAAVADFFIMDREVTNELFTLFLFDNPEWRIENKESLMAKGLVNQDYLKDLDNSETSSPVNFVSWYAAEAFCTWLEGLLPDFLSDYRVELPDEYQWEWAALTDSEKSGVFKDEALSGPASANGRYPNESGFIRS